MHPQEKKVRQDKTLAQDDVSKCLPGWIETFCKRFEEGNGAILSHASVSAIGHTLIAAKVRNERLMRERDKALEELERAELEIKELGEKYE